MLTSYTDGRMTFAATDGAYRHTHTLLIVPFFRSLFVLQHQHWIIKQYNIKQNRIKNK